MGGSISSSMETLDGSSSDGSPRCLEALPVQALTHNTMKEQPRCTASVEKAALPAALPAVLPAKEVRSTQPGKKQPSPAQVAAAATASARKAAADALTESFLQSAMAPDRAHAESKASMGGSTATNAGGCAVLGAWPRRQQLRAPTASAFAAAVPFSSGWDKEEEEEEQAGGYEGGFPLCSGRRSSAEMQRHTEAFELLCSADFNLKRALEFLRSARDTSGEP